MHLKRNLGSCFDNNDNPVSLKAWEGNLNIQPIRYYYKALTYMTTYFSNSESENLKSLKQAARKIKNRS